MYVSGLSIYPVKSCAGIDVERADVQPWGLENDRRWMVVDPEGTTITARTRRRLLHVRDTPRPDGGLELAAPGMAGLAIRRPCRTGGEVALTMSRIDRALAAGPEADEWFSELLGEPARLVWLDDPGRRTVSAKHGGEPADRLTFADAGPILITTTSSLEQLDRWLAQTASERGEEAPGPLSMVRFRPNIVVDGSAEPFAEDEWKRLWIGDVELRFGEHCDRCVLPTIDPVTLEGSKEPTRTLALRRQWDHEVHFGVRMIPVATGSIRVGDEVRV